jgi:hypothetical protein
MVSKVVIRLCVEAVECGVLGVAERRAAVLREGYYEVCEVTGVVTTLLERGFWVFI